MNDNCPICLEDLKETNLTIFNCGHSCHFSCWSEFSVLTKTELHRCMLCRSEIYSADLKQRIIHHTRRPISTEADTLTRDLIQSLTVPGRSVELQPLIFSRSSFQEVSFNQRIINNNEESESEEDIEPEPVNINVERGIRSRNFAVNVDIDRPEVQRTNQSLFSALDRELEGIQNSIRSFLNGDSMRSQRIERSLQHSQSVVRIPPLELPSRSLRPRRNINRIIENLHRGRPAHENVQNDNIFSDNENELREWILRTYRSRNDWISDTEIYLQMRNNSFRGLRLQDIRTVLNKMYHIQEVQREQRNSFIYYYRLN